MIIMKKLLLFCAIAALSVPAQSQRVGEVLRSGYSYAGYSYLGSGLTNNESNGWAVYQRGRTYLVMATRVVSMANDGGWTRERIRTLSTVTLQPGEEAIVECENTLTVYRGNRWRGYQVNSDGSISYRSGRGNIDDCGG
jgi:hypothetical protein